MLPVVVALLFVQLFFGTLPIAVKLVLREMTSPALALVRVAGASLVFLALHRVLVREPIRERRDHGLLAVYAVFGVILNQLLYITALSLTTATAAQTVVAAGPAITLLIALLARKETATRLKWVGIGVAAAGALLLVGAGARTGSALGNLLALLNVARDGRVQPSDRLGFLASTRPTAMARTPSPAVARPSATTRPGGARPSSTRARCPDRLRSGEHRYLKSVQVRVQGEDHVNTAFHHESFSIRRFSATGWPVAAGRML